VEYVGEYSPITSELLDNGRLAPVLKLMTTAERNQLSDGNPNALLAGPQVGSIIFNTTTSKVQVCTVGGNSPTWVDLH
jgi:hypothetical protein